MLSLSYQSLDDFTGLSAVREAVARGDTGLLIHDLPPLIRELPFKDIVGLQGRYNPVLG